MSGRRGGEGALFWSLERPQIPTTGDRPFCPVGCSVSSLRAINHVQSVRYTYLITRIVNALALLNSLSFALLIEQALTSRFQRNGLTHAWNIRLSRCFRLVGVFDLSLSLDLFTLYFRILLRFVHLYE